MPRSDNNSTDINPFLSTIRHVVMKGGGSKGKVYLEFIKVLRERGVLARIDDLAGSSAGAITAGLVAVGASDEQLQCVLNTKFSDLLKDSRVVRAASKLKSKVSRAKSKVTEAFIPASPTKVIESAEGLMPANRVSRRGISLSQSSNKYLKIKNEFNVALLSHFCIEDSLLVRKTSEVTHQLETLGNDTPDAETTRQELEQQLFQLAEVEIIIQHITDDGFKFTFAHLHLFHQLFPEVFKDLFVTGNNLTDQTLVVFSHLTTPEEEVVSAINISSNLPIAFAEIKLEHEGRLCKFNDGGSRNNVPADIFYNELEPLFQVTTLCAVCADSLEELAETNPDFTSTSFFYQAKRKLAQYTSNADILACAREVGEKIRVMYQRGNLSLLALPTHGVSTTTMHVDEATQSKIDNSAREVTTNCLDSIESGSFFKETFFRMIHQLVEEALKELCFRSNTLDQFKSEYELIKMKPYDQPQQLADEVYDLFATLDTKWGLRYHDNIVPYFDKLSCMVTDASGLLELLSQHPQMASSTSQSPFAESACNEGPPVV